MDGENVDSCPCPSDCPRHGDCTSCRAFHHDSGERTYCEQHARPPSDAPSASDLARDGYQIRLLNYGPCAG